MHEATPCIDASACETGVDMVTSGSSDRMTEQVVSSVKADVIVLINHIYYSINKAEVVTSFRAKVLSLNDVTNSVTELLALTHDAMLSESVLYDIQRTLYA